MHLGDKYTIDRSSYTLRLFGLIVYISVEIPPREVWTIRILTWPYSNTFTTFIMCWSSKIIIGSLNLYQYNRTGKSSRWGLKMKMRRQISESMVSITIVIEVWLTLRTQYAAGLKMSSVLLILPPISQCLTCQAVISRVGTSGYYAECWLNSEVRRPRYQRLVRLWSITVENLLNHWKEKVLDCPRFPSGKLNQNLSPQRTKVLLSKSELPVGFCNV